MLAVGAERAVAPAWTVSHRRWAEERGRLARCRRPAGTNAA